MGPVKLWKDVEIVSTEEKGKKGGGVYEREEKEDEGV